ncbi:MAG: sulfite exporter TauE/SafE family protein, partial [Planctomycetaceae bacterium]|nr:sulfite exporter TauE/SafE family protein [Planctomycetaceae bacterium]
MEWSLVFLGGLAGSSHCIGMCGGFAMLIGLGAKTVRQNLFAQLMYSLGRIFTYAVIGGAAGFLGSRLGDQLSGWVSLPAILSVAAGLVLIVQGLATAGVP